MVKVLVKHMRGQVDAGAIAKHRGLVMIVWGRVFKDSRRHESIRAGAWPHELLSQLLRRAMCACEEWSEHVTKQQRESIASVNGSRCE